MTRWFVLGLIGGARVVLRMIPRIKKGAWALLDLVMLLVGLALVVAGVAQWSVPAAYVLAGLAFIALGYMPISRRS